jgi:hypothetical protein
MLRHIRDFFQTVFKVEEVKKEDVGADGETLQQGGATERLILTVLGIGYSNLSKRTA